MGLILLILLILLLLGATPRWRYNKEWGYRPFGLVTILLIVLIVLLLTGNIHI